MRQPHIPSFCPVLLSCSQPVVAACARLVLCLLAEQSTHCIQLEATSTEVHAHMSGSGCYCNMELPSPTLFRQWLTQCVRAKRFSVQTSNSLRLGRHAGTVRQTLKSACKGNRLLWKQHCQSYEACSLMKLYRRSTVLSADLLDSHICMTRRAVSPLQGSHDHSPPSPEHIDC